MWWGVPRNRGEPPRFEPWSILGSLGTGYLFAGRQWGTDPGKLIGLRMQKLGSEKELRFPSKNSILPCVPSVSPFFCCSYQIRDRCAILVVPTLQCWPSKRLMHVVQGSVCIVVCQNLTHEIFPVAGSISVLYVRDLQKL